MAKHRHAMHAKKKAEGGSVNEYNAKGSPEAASAKDEKASFRKGGSVHGTAASKRLDKRARGGRMGGGSPYSSAKSQSGMSNGGSGNGREMNAPSVGD